PVAQHGPVRYTVLRRGGAGNRRETGRVGSLGAVRSGSSGCWPLLVAVWPIFQAGRGEAATGVDDDGRARCSRWGPRTRRVTHGEIGRADGGVGGAQAGAGD